MARMHGKDCRVYIGGRDASGDIVSVTPEATSETHDNTTLGMDWYEFLSGLLGYSLAIEALYDTVGIGPQMEDVGGSFVASIFDGDADALGETGLVLPAGLLEKRGQTISIGDLVKLPLSMKGSGKAGLNAKLLHINEQETITGVESSVDNGAASANGGRANLHVTAITGTWTIIIEHSADDGAVDPWTTVGSFTQVAQAGGVTAESISIAGTIKRYTRVSFTEDVAGSITFLVGLARY